MQNLKILDVKIGEQFQFLKLHVRIEYGRCKPLNHRIYIEGKIRWIIGRMQKSSLRN